MDRRRVLGDLFKGAGHLGYLLVNGDGEWESGRGRKKSLVGLGIRAALLYIASLLSFIGIRVNILCIIHGYISISIILILFSVFSFPPD